MLKALQPWKEVIDKEGKVVVGRTLVDLTKSDCGTRECNLGNFVCDSMLHTVSAELWVCVVSKLSFSFQFVGLTPFDQPGWTNVSIALAATGGLRVPLLRGSE